MNPVDTYLRSNTDNRGPKLPYTPGSDAAGVVEAVGPGVTNVKAGDRVYIGGCVSGTYAEIAVSRGAGASAARQRVVRSGRGAGHPVRDGLPRALPSRA